MRGGHHAAFCTFLSEVGHKHYIKSAAKFSRTYGSRNETQLAMLYWVLRQEVWAAAITCASNTRAITPDSSSDDTVMEKSPRNLLSCTDDWSDLHFHERTPVRWGASFVSCHILVTRDELLTLLRTKLNLPATLRNNALLASGLCWEFYGALTTSVGSTVRKFVGSSVISKSRRDFVRLRGILDETALAIQVK